MNPKLNLAGVECLVNDINNKVKSNFITNVTIINSSDILLSFSFYNKEKLLISLNHNSPFISFVDSEINSPTTLGNLNENLRKYIRGSYIVDVSQINQDRVIKFTLNKTNEFYEKETYYLVLELIPTINNLIILDHNENVVFAKHYLDLSASRPLLKGMKYQPVESNPQLVKKEFDYEAYKEDVKSYLLELEGKTKKEKALPLYNHLKQKLKSLNKKISILEKEKETAESYLIYKDIGENLLTYMYDKDELQKIIDELDDSYNKDISPKDNAVKYFEKYKKALRTIENDNREIEIAKNGKQELEHIISIFSYYSEGEIEELYKKYLPKYHSSKKKKEVDSRLPYFIKFSGVTIGFGKNKEQNNYLTFKKANKEDIFLHTSSYHGAHVIIFDKDPKEEVILLASEIALILSNLEAGEVQIADVKDVKKGDKVGKVLLNKYQTITIHKIREKSKLLLKDQKRFSN